ncbi:MAG: DUF2235 domain-containing protein [Candidatus Thiodiazotropha sp. 6PDIVS]
MALYAFDGTWNDSSAPDDERDIKKDTNVHRFRQRYGENHHYVNGVGTRYGFIGKIIGGATGAGAQKRIEEHFQALKENFANGDETIDIVGYSRGAAISRMFVHYIDHHFDNLVDKSGNYLLQPPTIRFLGLFDTVASFGIPWSEDEHDFETNVPEIVENTFHAMALDETRETFGIERCLGNRDKITEVWFRGGHGDIGGNATFTSRSGEESNRKRSDIALEWMLNKANACGLPIVNSDEATHIETDTDAQITAQKDRLSIGSVGTLSRRIHIGDLVHYSVEDTDLTLSIDGSLLRRIEVLTRIEDRILELRSDAMNWIPPFELAHGPDNVRITESSPSLVRLSLRRYPFDVLPARTWNAWLKHWEIENPGIDDRRIDEFWAPNDADRALAWDIYVELQTRIAVQKLADDEGDDTTALTSIAKLFALSRDSMRKHGVNCSNTGALVTAYLNQKVRCFTAKWHKVSLAEKWADNLDAKHTNFREELKQLQPVLRTLAGALSHLADARL